MPRIQLLVTGIVQGVGFRPFCARLARRLHLAGWVRNTSQGVAILLEGPEGALSTYRGALLTEAPPLARVRTLRDLPPEATPLEPEVFSILPSQSRERTEVLIPPDLTCCPACLGELRDPADRRYRYPFLNCTDCGPRYSLIRELPYDRPGTTMACFPQCEDCEGEYRDPTHRRFHAQPNACPACGPRVWLADREGHVLAREDEAIR